MKTQITASAFWKLYIDQKQKPSKSLEDLRHTCILGFTAIDAAIYTYWSQSVISEWGEFMSLVQVSLEDPSEISQSTSAYLKKSQLIATMRFLSNTGDAERFTPNFLDFSIYLSLCFPHSPEKQKIAELLALLQPLRNQALHTGRDWSEIIAHQALKAIEECCAELPLLGKNFGEAFQTEELPHISTNKTKKAA
jgi:hypothetical protein